VNTQLLIDAIVRQTTVLVAQLATSGGVRAPLAGVANQVFLELSDELYAQGISRKVSADMFGMALRTYLRKIQRLRESSTDGGTSLWEAVLGFLSREGLVTRAEVLRRFHRDDADIVRGVLHDLVETGLVLKSGSGPRTAYRAATAAELESVRGDQDGDGTDELVWAIVFREGPIGQQALRTFARGADVAEALERLVTSGRVQQTAVSGGVVYSTRKFEVPLGAEVGWEGAVFDHFQAVVKAILSRLRSDGAREHPAGGSTYSFEVWPGHPHEAEVLDLLDDLRRRTGTLKEKVSAYNAANSRPARLRQVTFYGGQSVLEQEEGDLEDGDQ
jgi:hypothetical protein